MYNAAAQTGKILGIVVATVIVVAASFGTARAEDRATSRITLTKLPALHLGGMERSAFYWQDAPAEATTRACLQTSGQHIPYRLSASSLSGRGGFSTQDSRHAGQVAYTVTWSDHGLEHSLNDSGDVTQVMRANSGGNCDLHDLSIDIDERSYDAAAAGTYTDTLSLFFVIE